MASGSSSLMPILLIGGVAVGALWYMSNCTGTDAAGVKKNCFGDANGDPGTGDCNPACASNETCTNGVCVANGPGPGGCTRTCSNGLVLDKSSCTCNCNRVIKKCGSNQVLYVNPCRCVTCPAGSTRNSNDACICSKACPAGTSRISGTCNCTKPASPCAGKTCNLVPASHPVVSGNTCICVCNKSCPAGYQRDKGRCNCDFPSGSSGNCGWTGNKYCWHSQNCSGNRVDKCITYGQPITSNRGPGCTAARNSWCDSYAVNPGGCKSGDGTGCTQGILCKAPNGNQIRTTTRAACCAFLGSNGGCKAPTPYGLCSPSNTNCTKCICSSKK